MKNTWKKLLAMTLAASMLTGMMGVGAWAEGDTSDGGETRTTYCGKEAHTHSAAGGCYEGKGWPLAEVGENTSYVQAKDTGLYYIRLNCEKEVHTHTDECYATPRPKVGEEPAEDDAAEVASYDELTAAIVAAGTEQATIKLTQSFAIPNGYLQITSGKDIILTADPDIVLSRETGGSILVRDSGKLTLKDITIDGAGDAGVTAKFAFVYVYAGGACEVVGDTVIKNCHNNNSKNGGGALYNAGTLTITGGTISGNAADNHGGGVYSTGTLTITGGTISGNTADNYGGGVYSAGTLTITDSTFYGNTAGNLGGGVYSTGTHTITGGMFSSNQGGNKYGGAVYSSSKTATNQIKDTEFTGNVNGAVAVSGGTLENLTITGTTGNGPALKLSGTVTVTGCTITDNANAVTDIENGGVVYCGALAKATFNNCTIADNTGVLCGGLNVGGDKATLYGTVIKNNTATSSEETAAGGIYVGEQGRLTFQSGALYNNGSLDLFRHQKAGDLWVMSAGKMVDPKLADNYFAAWNYAWQRNGELSQEEIIEHVQSDYVESHEVRLIAVAQAVPETEVEGVYLHSEGDHTDGETANTLTEAVKLAKDNDLDTVYVCGNVDVTTEADVNALNSGIHFVRCQEHPNGYMFTIMTNAELGSAHIDGNQVPGDAALIYVPSEGKLTISGTTVIENGNNAKSDGAGGAIDVGGSSLTITGGTITGNRAANGGGIYAHSVRGYSNGSTVAFEGGEISNNIAFSGGYGGGGAMIEDSTSNFGVNGGRTVFDGNVSAGLGGGVFLRFGTHRIYKATFTNNQANRLLYYFDGGAIYVEEYTVAYMKNVFVSGSTTNRDGAAAVAVCPTGELAVYELDGLLSTNNNDGMMDIGTIHGGITSAIPKVYLPGHVIGGGEVSYTKSDGIPVDISDLQFVEGFFSLKTVIPANDEGQVVANAKAVAETDGVIITGNHANEYGAAIMTNGVLKIGTETTTLRVNKVWADGAENHENDQVLVYLTQDGKPVSQGFRSDSSVILNKDNNWSYVWSNLGDYETFKWGVKEASVDGYTSEAKVEKDTEYGVIADKYYIATLTNTPSTEAAAKSLVITKTAIGLDPDASYEFTLKLDNVGDGAYAIQLPDGTLNPIFNNETTFYMKDGQSAVVDGLPEGYTYKVTEAEGDYVTHVLNSETLDESGSITVVDVVNIAKTGLTVNKVWAGDDDTAVRPTSIFVDLMNAETLVKSAMIEPDAEGNWTYTFDDLPMYDAAGDKIAYTVAEVEVPENYTSSQVVNEDGTVTITNTYTRPTTPGGNTTYTSLTVNKVWAGDDEETRPNSVQVQLYRNGTADGDPITLSTGNRWRHTWSGLDENATWTVEEIDVPDGYTDSQSRNGTRVTITNTYTASTPTPEPTPTETPVIEDLGENDTPLAELPTETQQPATEPPKEEIEELEDEDVPMAQAPETGDNLGTWLMMSAGALLGLAWLGRKKEEA